MAEKIKYTQKELKKPDKFRQFATDLLDQSSKNFNKILYFIAGIMVVIIILFVISSSKEKRTMLANELFEKTLVQYNKGEITKAIDYFTRLVEEYPNEKAAKLSRYYLGIINFDIGEYEKSIDSLNDFINNASSYDLLKDSANLNIGLAYYNLGNWQEAVTYFSKLENTDSPYKEQASIHLGLSYEKLGQFDKAEEIYKNYLNVNNSNTIQPETNVNPLQ